MGRGGKRINSGRKPKTDELKLIEQMDKTGLPIEVWKLLWRLVEIGDFNAIKLWLAYRYGQPKPMKDFIERPLDEYKPPVIRVVLPQNAKSLKDEE